jgi:hypothetical protein
MSKSRPDPESIANPPAPDEPVESSHPEDRSVEIGGRGGPEPTRYGDWEKNGRCIDF